MKNSPFHGKKVKVLLMKPLPGKGNAGDVIEVKTHYALYVLLPKGIAVVYDKQVENQRAAKMKQIDAHKAKLVEDITVALKTVENNNGISFEKAATDMNKLYDTINSKSIANYFMTELNVHLDTSHFAMEKIEELGEYTLTFTHGDVTQDIAIHVNRKEA